MATQFAPTTARDFLASIKGADGEPLAKAGTRGRFSKAASEALAEAHADGFVFIGEAGHPQTEVKAPKTAKAPKASTPAAPRPQAPVSTPTVSAPARAVPAPGGFTVAAPGASVARRATAHPAAAKASFVAADVRAWAVANGVKVGQRGRIHPDVIGAFVQANPNVKPTVATVGTVRATTSQVRANAPEPRPFVREQGTGYTIVDGRLLAQSTCGARDCGQSVRRCTCQGGPRSIVNPAVTLTFDKPVL